MSEFRAVRRLIERSGLPQSVQLRILSRGFHISNSNQQQRPNDEDKDKKDNDEKMSSVFAKVFLWLLTAYMIVAVMSLILPNSDQPEVNFNNNEHLIYNLFKSYIYVTVKAFAWFTNKIRALRV